MGCFPVDAEGVEIVRFATPPTADRSELLVLHRLLTIAVCSLGLAANGTLLAAVRLRPAALGKMRAVVVVGAVLEAIPCAICLFALPLNHVAYGRSILFSTNGLHVQSAAFNSLLLATNNVLFLCLWSFPTFQFIFRLHLVKHGHPPRGWRLRFYAAIPVGTSGVFGWATVRLIGLGRPRDERRFENSALILRQHGLPVGAAELVEISFKDSGDQTASGVFLVMLLLNYAAVVYCALRIRRFTRAGVVISAATRRLNRELDRVLFFNSICPLVCNLLPSALLTATMAADCEEHPWTGVATTLVVDSTFLLCPLSTLFSVRPYRQMVGEWLRGAKRTVGRLETSATVRVISRRFL